MRDRFGALVERALAAARALPRPTPLQWAKASPFLLGGVVMLVLVGRNFDTVEFPQYAAPEGYEPAPPPATDPPGFERPALAAVAGETTTTVPANVGTARLSGTVRGPQGLVPGAVVRIERSILGQVQRTDVLTDAAGAWDVPGIGGGRYRVRAFLPPTLAQRTAEVFLLPAGESRSLDLVTEAFGEPIVALAAAPAPAFLDQQVNVAVQVTAQTVDGDGFVTMQGLPGLLVDVRHSDAWDRETTPGALVTDGGGRVVVTYTCRAVGSVQIDVTVRTSVTTPPPAPPPTDPSAPSTVTTAPAGAPVPPITAQATFDCVDPASLTTTTTAPAEDGPGNSTSSTTSTSTTEAPDG